MSVQIIDLARWETPPCPRCADDASALRIEDFTDDSFFALTRIERAREMSLQPCGHPISGYTIQGDQVEWMPYV